MKFYKGVIQPKNFFVFFLLIILFESKRSIGQCSLLPTSNYILRQPNLYQLIGSNDGAYDTPNGQQGVVGGNSLSNGNWLNRGSLNLIGNGDFSLPGAVNVSPLLANGLGVNGIGAVQIPTLPNWTIHGNSVNAYPRYALNFWANPGQQAVTDFGASPINLYLGNSLFSLTTQTPVFNNGYATNSISINPYITAQGIAMGFGQASGEPISIEQNISTTFDSIYRLQFYVTGESFGWTNPWIMGLDISGYQRLILYVPGATNVMRYEFEFKAKGNSTTIKFVNWGHSISSANTTEFVLDDVIVNQVQSNCSVLPIDFKSFDLVQQNENVNLKWQTSMEQNCNYFNIEFSADGKNWQSLGDVKANGYSNIVRTYTFLHKKPKAGRSYYRIKQIDYDGKYSYSEIKSILVLNENGISILNDLNNLSIYSLGTSKINSVSIYSLNGQLVYQLKNKSSDKIDVFNYKNFLPGLYFLQIKSSNGKYINRKIVKP